MNGKYGANLPEILKSVRMDGTEDGETTVTYRCEGQSITREQIMEVLDYIHAEGVSWLEITIPYVKSDIIGPCE
jgi:hypothetical protein